MDGLPARTSRCILLNPRPEGPPRPHPTAIGTASARGRCPRPLRGDPKADLRAFRDSAIQSRWTLLPQTADTPPRRCDRRWHAHRPLEPPDPPLLRSGSTVRPPQGHRGEPRVPKLSRRNVPGAVGPGSGRQQHRERRRNHRVSTSASPRPARQEQIGMHGRRVPARGDGHSATAARCRRCRVGVCLERRVERRRYAPGRRSGSARRECSPVPTRRSNTPPPHDPVRRPKPRLAGTPARAPATPTSPSVPRCQPQRPPCVSAVPQCGDQLDEAVPGSRSPPVLSRETARHDTRSRNGSVGLGVDRLQKCTGDDRVDADCLGRRPGAPSRNGFRAEIGSALDGSCAHRPDQSAIDRMNRRLARRHRWPLLPAVADRLCLPGSKRRTGDIRVEMG